jgi:twitching motility protein PilT
MLANTLQAVITQTLLKRKSSGRTAAYEIMVGTPAVRNLIREGKIPQLFSMLQMGSRYGMITMKDSIINLFTSGAINETTAKSALSSVLDEDPDANPGGILTGKSGLTSPLPDALSQPASPLSKPLPSAF